jgi:hypothetical protein
MPQQVQIVVILKTSRSSKSCPKVTSSPNDVSSRIRQTQSLPRPLLLHPRERYASRHNRTPPGRSSNEVRTPPATGPSCPPSERPTDSHERDGGGIGRHLPSRRPRLAAPPATSPPHRSYGSRMFPKCSAAYPQITSACSSTPRGWSIRPASLGMP